MLTGLIEQQVVRGFNRKADGHALAGHFGLLIDKVLQAYGRFSRTQTQATIEPPGLGEHSRQVLAEAGVDAARIQALLDASVLKQGGPFRLAAIQSYR